MIDGFDIVRGMPLDYMHGVLLGVVKMLFSLWFDSKYKKERFYIGDKITTVDERLVKCPPPPRLHFKAAPLYQRPKILER